MNGKENLLATLRSQPAERTPWVPFVGVHGGALVDQDATLFLKSADTIVAGLTEAVKRYRPDGLPVVFDLQLEAEILGCQLSWAPETPPSVVSHPLGEGADLASLPAFDLAAGRFPLVLEATRRMRQAFGDEVALYGLLCGPLTLALHLRGDELLLDLFDEAESVPRLFEHCAGIARQIASAYVEAGADVIAVVDPMISQIGPDHFTRLVAPHLDAVFDHVRELGAVSSLFVCGNASRNLEAMAATRCDNISVDENVDLARLAEVARAAGKSFGGNLQLTTVLLLGDTDDVRRDTLRCFDQAGEGPGFVLSPGCDLPYAVKIENMETVAELVHDDYQRRIARNLPPKDDDDSYDDVVVPRYPALREVVIDVVTLDSAGCAPCAYMCKAAEEAARRASVPAQVREHKITGRDGLGYMKKLAVSAIPSICIDGVPRYASIIPQRSELVAAIDEAGKAKGGA